MRKSILAFGLIVLAVMPGGARQVTGEIVGTAARRRTATT